MADIPIIFSAPMVRALLDGRKTMTRRLLYVKRKARNGLIPASASFDQRFPPPIAPLSPEGWPTDIAPDEYQTLGPWRNVRAPAKDYPGDRLWVRENFAYKAVGVYYPSDTDGTVKHAWRPSIHMPRACSRLTLVVTAVKIEPLQSITDDDAMAEGIQYFDGRAFGVAMPGGWMPLSGLRPAQAFRSLWQMLHGPDSWDGNPWVVAPSFTVHQCNIDAMQERAA